VVTVLLLVPCSPYLPQRSKIINHALNKLKRTSKPAGAAAAAKPKAAAKAK
jgi:hypothetical protein